MSEQMRKDLDVWQEQQLARPEETGTEHDLRRAFVSLRFMQRYHQQLLHPWRQFTDPAARAIAMDGRRVLIRNAQGFISIARWVEHRESYVDDYDNYVSAFSWMEIP